MRMRKSPKGGPNHELEVWTKGVLRASGKRRVDMIVRFVEDGSKDKESEVYRTVLKDIREYLPERNSSNTKFLPIPKYFKADNSGDSDQSLKSGIFLLEDPKNSGFVSEFATYSDGLDYEHSLLVVASLARLHASSYCYRKERKMQMEESYPVLKQEVVIPALPENIFNIITNILEESPVYQKYSSIFLTAVREGFIISETKLDSFGVVNHGQVVDQNILFKYKKQLDSTLSCTDSILQDMSHCYYGSCVMDLLQVIFATINIEVRQSFLADFVCSVYYDSFAKTVSSINKEIAIFTKKQFIKEFDRNIMYGFLFSLHILRSTLPEDMEYQEQERSLSSFRSHVLALVRDIIQFRVNAQVTLN